MAKSDQEWWEADVDRDAATESLRSIGLEPAGWVNRRPVFTSEVDWLTVEACVFEGAGPIPDPSEDASADPVPKKKVVRRKR